MKATKIERAGAGAGAGIAAEGARRRVGEAVAPLLVGSSSGGSSGASPVASANRPGIVTARDVRAAVLRALGVGLTEFVGRGRRPEAVDARGVFVRLSRQYTRASFPEIAALMKPEGAASNHSTSVTANRRMERNLPADERLRERLELARAALLAQSGGMVRRAVPGEGPTYAVEGEETERRGDRETEARSDGATEELV